MKFQDYIIEYDNVIPRDKCKEIIERFEADDRTYPGVVGNGEISNVKISTDLNITPYEDWKDIDTLFFNGLTGHLREYVKMMQDNGHEMFTEQVGDSGYQIQRTDVGGKYGWHHDEAYHPFILWNEYNTDDFNISKNSDVIAAKMRRRIVTYIFYLNDASEFGGGKTKFKSGNGEENTYDIIPEAGKLVLFPSFRSYIHCGEPVTSGKKYICTGWAHDFYNSYVYAQPINETL